MTDTDISADFPYQSHYVDIHGAKIHYIKEGSGDPILFLHGVPASSYVWRNVIPHLAALGCCIAPDLPGFGKSDKPAIAYTITDYIHYIDQFIETLKLDRIVLVMHGLGSVIGFDYAMRHPEKCKGLIFYEAWLRAVHPDDISLPFQEQLHLWREQGDISGVDFINQTVPKSVMRRLTETELNYYRDPFRMKGAEKPLIQYVKELPTGDNHTAVTDIIANYSPQLMQSSLPKLMLYSIPGFMTTMATLIWAKNHLPHLEMGEIGEGLHYSQESQPALMGETISVWLQGVEQDRELS